MCNARDDESYHQLAIPKTFEEHILNLGFENPSKQTTLHAIISSSAALSSNKTKNLQPPQKNIIPIS